MALPAKIPRIITWHSDIIKQKHLLKLYKPFQRHSILQAKAVIAATQAHFISSQQIPSEYPQKNRHVIPFGMDFGKMILTHETANHAKKIRSQAADKFIVFSLGRHVSYKGFDVLIEAMKNANAYLILGGEGPLTQQLKEQVYALRLTNKVHFTGRIQDKDLPAYYHACDVFCLPSVSSAEAFGIVQLEAMSCGKPVICSQLHNGVNEINPHMKTGLTVPASNHNLLADAINKLQNNFELRKLLGSYAKNHALENFSISNMIRQHIQLYKTVATSQN
jgi:rhamnosyl/mannosyltransferase